MVKPGKKSSRNTAAAKDKNCQKRSVESEEEDLESVVATSKKAKNGSGPKPKAVKKSKKTEPAEMEEAEEEGAVAAANSKKSKKPAATKRRKPNILISGTPGTGKSTLAKRLASAAGLEWINVGDVAKEKKCLGAWDETYGCHELEEDPLLDALEERVGGTEGGALVDHHVTDFFPERWFDLVLVLRTDTTVLHGRLAARGYDGKKMEDNMQCEIFQTVLDEAKEAYRHEIVHELKSNSEEDIESNVERIQTWIKQWLKDNAD